MDHLLSKEKGNFLCILLRPVLFGFERLCLSGNLIIDL